MRPLDVRVVLVRPQGQANIGAAARAIANMGANRLVLVGARTGIGVDAATFAASAGKILDERIEYQDWESFFANEPDGLRFAFTARDGKGRRTRPFEKVLAEWAVSHPSLREESEVPLTVHLVFGPEEHGLAAEDLLGLHAACLLPVFGDNPSLNLSQAVLLALYVLRRTWSGEIRPARDAVRGTETSIFPEALLRDWLECAGFDLDDRKTNALTILRGLLRRAAPTTDESRVLEGALHRSLRKMGARPASVDASADPRADGPDAAFRPGPPARG